MTTTDAAIVYTLMSLTGIDVMREVPEVVLRRNERFHEEFRRIQMRQGAFHEANAQRCRVDTSRGQLSKPTTTGPLYRAESGTLDLSQQLLTE